MIDVGDSVPGGRLADVGRRLCDRGTVNARQPTCDGGLARGRSRYCTGTAQVHDRRNRFCRGDMSK